MNFADLLHRYMEASGFKPRMTRPEIVSYALIMGAKLIDAELFADACLTCGIGDGEPVNRVGINVYHV